MFIYLKRKDVTSGNNGVMACYRDPESKNVVNVGRVGEDGLDVEEKAGLLILEQSGDVFRAMDNGELKINNKDEDNIRQVVVKGGQTVVKDHQEKNKARDDVAIVLRDWKAYSDEDKKDMYVRELNVIISVLGEKVPNVQVKKSKRIKMINELVAKKSEK